MLPENQTAFKQFVLASSLCMGFPCEKKNSLHKMCKTASIYGFVIWVSAWKDKNDRLPQKEMHFHRQRQ